MSYIESEWSGVRDRHADADVWLSVRRNKPGENPRLWQDLKEGIDGLSQENVIDVYPENLSNRNSTRNRENGAPKGP
jgi:hypothetical protein